MEDDTEEGSKRTYISPPSKRESVQDGKRDTSSAAQNLNPLLPFPTFAFLLRTYSFFFSSPKCTQSAWRRSGTKKTRTGKSLLPPVFSSHSLKTRRQKKRVTRAEKRRAARDATRIPVAKGRKKEKPDTCFSRPFPLKKSLIFFPFSSGLLATESRLRPEQSREGFFPHRSPRPRRAKEEVDRTESRAWKKGGAQRRAHYATLKRRGSE